MTRHPLGLAALFLIGSSAALPVPGRTAPAAPAPAAVDFALLQRALAPLSSTSGLKLSSTVALTGNDAGISVAAQTQLQVVARRPGQFRINVTRPAGQGTPPKRFVLVSNGTKVWTYAPGTNRYSVMTYAAFDNSDDNILSEGLITSFYLGAGHELIDLIHGLDTGDSTQVLSELKEAGIVLTQRSQPAGNQDETVYQMAIPKDKYRVYFHVSTRTSQLIRFEIAGTSKGTQIALREDITQSSSLAGVPKSTFYFMPPPGAVRTAQISVSP